jgi:hypothetical protein
VSGAEHQDPGPEVGVDQVGVVTEEGGVRDAEAPLDGGDGRAFAATAAMTVGFASFC